MFNLKNKKINNFRGSDTDITLVRIVLSACSSVFRKIIDRNRTQYLLMYLRGIQSYEVESILQFMYLGEGRFFA